MDRNSDIFLTAEDVAGIMKLKVNTIYRMIKNDTLPQPVKIGKSFRWNREDFLNDFNLKTGLKKKECVL